MGGGFPGDPPVEGKAVLPAVQGHGGLPPDLLLEGGKIPGGDIGRVADDHVKALVFEGLKHTALDPLTSLII